LKTRSNFLLSKWYLDCVADDGELFIAYVASLKWQGVSINYSSTLHRQADGQTETNTSLREASVPHQAGAFVEWRSAHLNVGGTWRARAEPVQRVLLETETGSLEWNCLQPCAAAEIRIGNEPQLSGLGYVEHLTLSIPPWNLPIEELRWGRFLSPTDVLVWIDWRGAKPLQLVFHNGNQIEGASISDDGLAGGEFVLNLEEKVIVREGPLVKTALSMIPGVGRIFPLRVLRTHECKSLSRGTLKTTAGGVASGWTIHEVVRWE